MRVMCVYFPPGFQGVSAFAEACLRVTPQVALGDHWVFLEIGACHKLYEERGAFLRIRALLKRFDLQAFIRIADDVPTALAMASYGVAAVTDLPLEALRCYAAPFTTQQSGMSPSSLGMQSLERTLVVLRKMGLRLLVELTQIPRFEITVRFGKQALFALQYLESGRLLPWPYFKPSEKIFESRDIDELNEVRELEPLLFVVRGVLDRVLLRLRGQGKLVSAFELRLFVERYSVVERVERKWLVEVSFPVGSVLSLLSILRDRINFALQREPLESSVIRVEVEVLRVAPSLGRQSDFFSKKEEERETLHEVMARLTERLGMGRAFMARAVESYWPERSWQKTFEVEDSISLPLPMRPLRVLRNPQPIHRIDNFLVHPRRRWLVHEMVGPERLSGEWWLNDQERDYFRVKTGVGEELWIYQVAGDSKDNRGGSKKSEGDYFLHGIFD